MHRSPVLAAADCADREGIPVTAVPRTLLDLAGTVSADKLGRAVEQAEKLQLFDLAAIDGVLARATKHNGVNRLRTAIALYRKPPFTRSELERRFIELIEGTDLPRPRVNAFVEGYELDIYWPEYRFAVELDGYEHHSSPAAFERDRIRDEELKLLGIELTRVTARRIEAKPGAVMRTLASLLEQRRLELARIRTVR